MPCNAHRQDPHKQHFCNHLVIPSPKHNHGQMMGIFPISGVFSHDAHKIRLDWVSVPVILNLVVLATALFNVTTEYFRLQDVGINPKNINGLLFFIDCITISVLFLHVATKWNKVAIMWEQVDRIFVQEPYGTFSSRWTLRRKIRIATVVLLLLALAEHLLSIVSLANEQREEIKKCGWEKNITDIFRHFALRKFPNVYVKFPYSTFSAVYFLYISAALTVYWNFLDIFIILVSIAIATRFGQIHTYLRTMTNGGLLPNEQLWVRVRTHYVSVCELLELVDRTVSWLVLVSCTTNLYFICLQILNVSQKLLYIMSDIYYWFSLLFLIGRTATMFLCAARIHETAKKPMDVVSKIPNAGWCVELDRFATQLKSETVALTGMGFFNMTRQLLFSMAGTIVTYELVMLKFDKETKGRGYIRPCTFFDIEKSWLMPGR
ncbi:gustatory receptor for sugar taste 64a-like [Topomyia yanbarensis]|uniref:gustatory receptor for sugar taste 64a-like n=1 Tax=Topomyia yanbarensis TaxID=2498891 RepID=UPI00273CA89D|nr:gustatory receptor for sugar taste 64a-like [Topomyia yanbarensis]